MPETRLPTIEEQKRFWEWHWGNWSERKTLNEWKDKRHLEILTLVGALHLANPKILDLGCGPGHYTKYFSHLGETTGIDLSEEAIRMARAKYPHVTFFAGNLYDYPLPQLHYDVVVSQEVFDHVEDQVAFLDRVASVLKPRGYLVMSCANRFVMERLGSSEFPVQPAAHIAKYLDMKELRRLLAPRFHVLRSGSIIPFGNGGILRIVNSHKLNNLLGLLIPQNRLDAVKERLGLCYQLIVLAQKRS